MSGIVLSASVRQNLLSLQSTADLLSTTQNRLATGNKVNSALDNPTNFFTAQGLNNRAERHQQSARQHRQRRAGSAGCQHRHHLAAEAGRYREVDRQPGAADAGRLFDASRPLLRQQPLGRHTRPICVDGAAHQGRSAFKSRDRRRSRDGIDVTFGAQRVTLDQLNTALAASNLSASSRQRRQARSSPPPMTAASRHTIGAVADRRGVDILVLLPRSEASMRRSPTRLRRPFAPTWSASTTTSSRRSPPPRRMRPSTASTC